MEKMKLLIPTSGRWQRQMTLEYLPPSIRKEVFLVVQAKEEEKYRRVHGNLIVLPEHITSLSPTRQWIIDNIEADIICLMDDDLRFYRRGRSDNPLYLQYNDEEGFWQMFRELELHARTGCHAGVSAREGNNRISKDYLFNVRMMRVASYNVTRVRKLGIRFDRLICKTDFDVTLQLLRKGQPNWVSYYFAQGQYKGSNASGGCSEYRTMEVLTTAAYELARLHPEFVTVVKKYTKTAWGGNTERTDVRIQWKKAFISSMKEKP
jgi:hypothetical protein